MTDSLLRQKLDRKEFFLAPGLHDMMAAVIARDLKFDIVYGSGFWLTACIERPIWVRVISRWTESTSKAVMMSRTIWSGVMRMPRPTGMAIWMARLK